MYPRMWSSTSMGGMGLNDPENMIGIFLETFFGDFVFTGCFAVFDVPFFV